ncbi:transcriptional regulator, TetR family [Cnuella takakiae]|uniref:Transcriptional regulator, TetR family n=1 Tax=Cnuella takakiae TaxID=1302690 RepID=A0A1M4SX69_9BACT|nr:TetR/AcrR family transcriptional regulator [Cnuella takakiae]OLY90618.1 TetR family transcriptional regulator [Cnuella takakiae]SHE36607.1 transcriptional regulator, TetR family [Cnuella takakiae]
MASKERIQRLKEETRTKILDAAYKIVKEEGWQALSMRKIADEIEYTAPIIYEYFSNKEAILAELNKKGFLYLAKEMETARDKHQLPADQLEAMWMAYWNFAFKKKELYQVMFGVAMNCCTVQKTPEQEAPANLVREVIQQLMAGKNVPETEVCRKYFTFWSVIHGLISINLVNRGDSDEINKLVLKDAIGGIIRSITG